MSTREADGEEYEGDSGEKRTWGQFGGLETCEVATSLSLSF